MKCIECGKGRMKRKAAPVPHEIRGLKFKVEGQAMVCGLCGFLTIPAELMEEHALLVDTEYRKAAGLLGAQEIRAARERLGLSQREFAEYLGVGEASVKRWESGALQDKSSDDLIRLRTDPGYARKNLEEVCWRLGRRSPTEPRRIVVFVQGPAGFQRPAPDWLLEGSSLQEARRQLKLPLNLLVH